MKKETSDCCKECFLVNAGINCCKGCICHTPVGEAIKENLQSMNNGLIFMPNQTKPREDIK